MGKNGDRVRRYNDAELADILVRPRPCQMCAYQESPCRDLSCREGVEKWLASDSTPTSKPTCGNCQYHDSGYCKKWCKSRSGDCVPCSLYKGVKE